MVTVYNKKPCQYGVVSNILDTIFELAGVTFVALNPNDW
jgi:hypothetical protein